MKNQKLTAFYRCLRACAVTIAVTAPFIGAPAQAQELNMWVMASTDQTQQDMNILLRPYLQKNPKLRVNVTVLQWETAWGKITAAAASGHGPDIIELGTTQVASIAAMNVLEQVSEQQQKALGGASAYFPAVWESTHRFDDKRIFALPWFAEANAAFYRTDVFKAAGIEPKDAFANWGSFKQAMQKINGTVINGKKVAAFAYPGKKAHNVVHNLAPWVWNAGGDFLSADKKQSAVNSPEAMQAIHYYTSFAVEGLVPSSALEKDAIQIENGFLNGQYAVIFTGPWIIKQLATPKAQGGYLESVTAKNFSVAPYPAGIKGQQTFFSGSDLAVMKSSKNKPEAWKLISYLLEKDTQVAYSKLSGMLPTRLDAAHDPNLMRDPHYAEFIGQIKHGRHYPSIPGWAAVETVYIKNFGNMYDIVAGVKGKYSPAAVKSVLDAASVEANQVLKEAQ